MDIQKAREKSVHIAVNAVGDGRAVAHQLVAISGGDPQTGIGRRQIANGLSTSIETAAGDAQQMSATSGKAGGLSEAERLKAARSVWTLVAHPLALGNPNPRQSVASQSGAEAAPARQPAGRLGPAGKSSLTRYNPFQEVHAD